MSADHVQRLTEHLWPHGAGVADDQVFAVLDGARDERIERLIRFRLQRADHACLYAGELSAKLRAAAPFLVRLSPGAPFTREFIETGWGDNWGILAVVPRDATLEDLRRHFRGLLRVKDESGRFLVFRYYDPRVLRAYLPTCTGLEAQRFFGPVPRILVESEDPATLLVFAPGLDGVLADEVDLAAQRTTAADGGA